MTALETEDRRYPSYWYHWLRISAHAFILCADACASQTKTKKDAKQGHGSHRKREKKRRKKRKRKKMSP